jgi:tetratricopeptide (TPR) repeat protein
VLVEQSLALYRTLRNQQGVGRCLFLIGWRAEISTNDHLLESLAIFRKIGDKLGMAEVLSSLGDKYNPVQTMAYQDESESIYRELGHLAGIADILHWKGETAYHQGDFETARSLREESLALRESLGLRRGRWTLTSLGDTYFRQGDYQRALEIYEQSMSISEQSGDKHYYLWTLVRQGYVFLRIGKSDQARAIFLECQQQFEETNVEVGVVFSTEGLASLALCQGQAEIAARLFGWADAARDASRDTRPPLEQADVDQQNATIMEMIGEKTYTQAYAEGQSMSMEEAMACSMEVSQPDRSA